MRKSNSSVVAILTSDWHMSDKPPIARSVEPSWYDVMERHLYALKILQSHFGGCPILVAGDLFDKWSNPPCLVNFLMDVMPEDVFAIPGQHDLKNHDYKSIDSTSYATLAKAGIIKNLNPKAPYSGIISGWDVYGFPWDHPINYKELATIKGRKQLALVHAYIWKPGYSFPGATDSTRAKNRLKEIGDLDAVAFGDNHKGFTFHQIINCGTLMRRKIDEIDYVPMVGLLHEDGTITPEPLMDDQTRDQDKFIKMDGVEKIMESMDLSDFITALSSVDLNKKFIDFKDAIKEFCETNQIGKVIRGILSEVME